LTCTGPSRRICNLYKIETMRCVNDGFDYDEEDVQWTCTASLPPEFKLGSTDVVCEGYRDAEDRWVLKGSCAVEYRLLLTERGEERFGGGRLFGLGWKRSSPAVRDWVSWIGNLLFLGFMVVPFGLVFLPAILAVLVCAAVDVVGVGSGEEGQEMVTMDMARRLVLRRRIAGTQGVAGSILDRRRRAGDPGFGLER
ncbi:DUF1183 domain protein, partial [Aspergillus sp. HF37]